MIYYCYYFKEFILLYGDVGMLGFYDVIGYVLICFYILVFVFYCYRICKVLVFGFIDLNIERNI